jgi:hypothetical protein
MNQSDRKLRSPDEIRIGAIWFASAISEVVSGIGVLVGEFAKHVFVD